MGTRRLCLLYLLGCLGFGRVAGPVRADPYTEEIERRILAAESQLQVDPRITLDVALAAPTTYSGRCIRLVGTAAAVADLPDVYPGFDATQLTIVQDAGGTATVDLIGSERIQSGTRMWALVTVVPPTSSRTVPRIVVFAPLTAPPSGAAASPQIGGTLGSPYLPPGTTYSAAAGPPGGVGGGMDPAVFEQYQFLSYLNLVRHFNPRLTDAEVRQVVTSLFRHAAVFGVTRPLIAALIKAESGFDPRSVSSAGAMGLCQLMPGTAEALGVGNAFDIDQSVRGGVQYLALQLQKFADRPNDERFALALACYNAGPKAVKENGGVPPYPETRNYIWHIAELFNELWRLGYR